MELCPPPVLMRTMAPTANRNPSNCRTVGNSRNRNTDTAMGTSRPSFMKVADSTTPLRRMLVCISR